MRACGVMALVIVLSSSTAHAQLLSPALTTLQIGFNVLKFILNIAQTTVLMVCNLDQNDEGVKAAYYSLIVHRPNENVTSCVVGCLASAAYNTKEAFVNVTKVDPFFLASFVMGKDNYQKIHNCALKANGDKCAMTVLFVDCVVSHVYSQYKKQVEEFQEGVKRVVNGFPRLVQQFITRDGYLSKMMGLLNSTSPGNYTVHILGGPSSSDNIVPDLRTA